HPEDDSAGRDLERNVDVRPLCEGVHPGIGAPCAVNPHRLTEHLRQRLFDDLLYRQRVRLRLPAAVARAEILDGEQEAHGFETRAEGRGLRAEGRGRVSSLDPLAVILSKVTSRRVVT